ncbi:MAG: DUF2764 domain-containing protein [Tannerella sp.]|jgi:hypothetical protein|nr:DUF2764 domain-containing protein [Tannerella sp.]
MSDKYYYLIAGLPDISIDDDKLPFTVLEFRDELDNSLSATDRKLMHLFFLKFDNRNLLRRLQRSDIEPEAGGYVPLDAVDELLAEIREAEGAPLKRKTRSMPPYFETFVRMYFAEATKTETSPVAWEDRLAALYYDYAMQCDNAFVAAWFELNLHIGNLLAAITCRKYGLNRNDYIVGDSEITRLLRTSGARDFGLGDTLEYLPAVQRIADESDLLLREKKTDQLKWDWMEEYTVFKIFTVERVLAWLLKLEIIERGAKLDKTTGEQMFRRLVGTMKTGSDNVLEEFKRNNKR